MEMKENLVLEKIDIDEDAHKAEVGLVLRGQLIRTKALSDLVGTIVGASSS